MSPPHPVVEELQVQILKLLLNNKDVNGVSGSQTRVGPWQVGGGGGLETQRAGAGSGPMAGSRLRPCTEQVQSEYPQLISVPFFLP